MVRVTSDDAVESEDMVALAVRRSVVDAMSPTVRPEAVDSVKVEIVLLLRRHCGEAGSWME